MKRWLTSAVAAIAIGTAALRAQTVPAAAPQLTLDDALALAARQNRPTAIDRLDVSKAALAEADAKAKRLPQFDTYLRAGQSLRPIDFTIPAGALGTFPATGPVPAHDATIATPQRVTGFISASVAQPLSQLHAIGLAASESALAREEAGEHLRAGQQDAAAQVRTLYYRIGETQAQRAAADVAVRYLSELSALTDRRVAQEAALRGDSLTVAARVAQARYQVLTLDDALDSEQESLNQLLGRDPLTPFSVADLPAPTLADLDLPSALTEAAASRPDLRQARLEAERTTIDIARARAGFWPDVTAELSYFSFPNVTFVPQNVVTVGVFVDWTPFDWGARRRRVAESRVAADQARLAVDEATAGVAIDVRAKLRALREARALVDVEAASRDAEREKLRVATDRYHDAAALLADLLQQQSAVAGVESDYAQALGNLWIARAAFDRAVGRTP